MTQPYPGKSYELTATFSDGTSVEQDSWKPFAFAARTINGKVTFHTTRASATRAAGKRGEATGVTCSDKKYVAWLASQGITPESSAPLFTEHGCGAQHRTHHTLAKCRWPRPTHCEHVFGDGPFGVYVERHEHYADHDGHPGALAVWPDIHLFQTQREATEFHERIGATDLNIRKSYAFMFPSDPRDASEAQDRTILGNHERWR